MYTRWPSCLALFIADTKKSVALEAGVLQARTRGLSTGKCEM